MSQIQRLHTLLQELQGHELLPGLLTGDPSLSPVWSSADFEMFGGVASVPASFSSFLMQVGGIEAIDVAQGVGFYRQAVLASLLQETWGHQGCGSRRGRRCPWSAPVHPAERGHGGCAADRQPPVRRCGVPRPAAGVAWWSCVIFNKLSEVE